MQAPEPSEIDLLIAAVLILVNGLLSVAFKLGLERQLIIAAVRTIAQLLLIGLLLKWLFERDDWTALVLIALVMTLIAGIAAVRRTGRRFPGIWKNSIVAVMASSWLVMGITLTAIIGPDVWQDHPAQYVIPLLGMVLGNTLNGISLGLDRLSEELLGKRDEVEMRLTLGATRWEAAHEAIQAAVRTGMIPIINSMMVVGVVSLPGMMTGQILAGAKPVTAVRYQIIIMFLIASGTALGTVGVVVLSYFRLFNRRHQFLYERISKARQ